MKYVKLHEVRGTAGSVKYVELQEVWSMWNAGSVKSVELQDV